MLDQTSNYSIGNQLSGYRLVSFFKKESAAAFTGGNRGKSTVKANKYVRYFKWNKLK